ncbi:hypothetical protein [Massilia genomosp. 1]|uniref:Uncharacterized protein n=1 Tax=Massilia genomosp. 1 TaxID=2609280 RepID=A0ABX0MWH0_9BURK|nr:hypothetical protein [Massilia genomosp. 1]NHZ67111.1 hypothetical protein [Massilia genomosp. 1]
MNSYFDATVEAMDLIAVRVEMNTLCASINAKNGFIETFADNRISDLRSRSKALGQEITLEIDPVSGIYVVQP